MASSRRAQQQQQRGGAGEQGDHGHGDDDQLLDGAEVVDDLQGLKEGERTAWLRGDDAGVPRGSGGSGGAARGGGSGEVVHLWRIT